MPDYTRDNVSAPPRTSQILTMVAFALTLLVLVVGGITVYSNARRTAVDRALVVHTYSVMLSLESLISTLRDVETSQRGYLLTSDDAYLQPYRNAVEKARVETSSIRELVSDNDTQLRRLQTLDDKVERRLVEIEQSIQTRRSGNIDSALTRLRVNTRRAVMDSVIIDVSAMQRVEQQLLSARIAKMERSYRFVILSDLLFTTTGIGLLCFAYYFFRRNNRQRQSFTTQLSRQKDLLDTTLESIGDAVISTDGEGKVTGLNKVAEELTGWSAADARGLPLSHVFEIINETTRQPADSPATRALSQGTVVGLANHTILVSRNGTEHPIDDSAAPISTDAGEILGCVLVFRDISERKTEERRLEQQRQRYEALVAATSQIVWTTNPAGRIVSDSQSWREFTGQTMEEWMKAGWLDALHPDDRERVAGEWRHALEHRTDYRSEYRLRRSDDAYRWTLVSAVPVLNEDGTVREWVGMNTDISNEKLATQQLQDSKDRLNFALAAADLGQWELNLTDGTSERTLRHDQIFGYQSLLEDWSYDDFLRHVVPEHRAQVAEQFDIAVSTGGLWNIECRIWNVNNEERWIWTKGLVQQDSSGAVARMIGIVGDMTERKQDAENLRRFAAELSEADRRKDEFLATLAHELRNPLAPIRNAAQLLTIAASSDERVRSASSVIVKQLVQLGRLVDELLDVSRISRGKIELRTAHIDLASVIEPSVDVSLALYPDRSGELTVNFPSERLEILADSTRLEQVIVNLLNNAFKFTDKGGRISLTVAREGDEAVVRIRDNGIGMDPDEITKIFGLFVQVDTSLERSVSGLGLGLTLVDRIVQMHGGTTEAFSEGAGHGSEFVVRLPIAQSPIQQPVLPLAEESTATKRLRILVVDDNEDSARTMAMLLQHIGNEAFTAFDGVTALEAAERLRPDLAILDIGLPGLNGYEVATKIRATEWGQAVKLIALTGWGQDEHRARSADAGFDAHLVKPAEFAELRKLVSRLASRDKAES